MPILIDEPIIRARRRWSVCGSRHCEHAKQPQGYRGPDAGDHTATIQPIAPRSTIRLWCGWNM